MFNSVIFEVNKPRSFHEIFNVLGKLIPNFPSNVVTAAKHGMNIEFRTSLPCLGGKKNKIRILYKIWKNVQKHPPMHSIFYHDD